MQSGYLVESRDCIDATLCRRCGTAISLSFRSAKDYSVASSSLQQ